MKIEDRVSAGAKRPVAVGSMGGDRLPAPPRERKPALAALAALLILAGALGATVLVMRAGDRVEAIQLAEDVSAGQPVPDSAMTPVMVAEEPGVNYVRWEQRERLGELRAETDLVAGSLLVGEMLSADPELPRDQVVVGLSLQPGQYPPGLESGDTVDAYWVGDASATDDTGGGVPTQDLIADDARVTEIHGEDGADGNSALSLRLRIDEDEVGALTRPASDGEVVVAVVPAD